MASSKILVTFFSHSGNTKVIAKKIQQLTGGDMFEIKTIKSYPEDYYKTTEVAKEEKRQNVRPELANKLDDISSYEVIFLGYPNWWGTMPMAVFTFLESYDFSGKTIVPFCTHEGSGMGNSERDIKKLCPNAEVLSGIAIRGSNVNRADKDLAGWLMRLGFIS
ncbi:flavodoxin [Caldicoprobacter guelmensis]|uniref:flavodoxin n=1 Tax=Caldicoprobacter guelmensis TaxID=1170224 RepID=UPI001FAEAA44|nr:flavodoxin [Caldicoprobacter guelmensis]MBM7581927.1 flavodoxin [Caldicoprobacter guelmensis]